MADLTTSYMVPWDDEDERRRRELAAPPVSLPSAGYWSDPDVSPTGAQAPMLGQRMGMQGKPVGEYQAPLTNDEQLLEQARAEGKSKARTAALIKGLGLLLSGGRAGPGTTDDIYALKQEPVTAAREKIAVRERARQLRDVRAKRKADEEAAAAEAKRKEDSETYRRLVERMKLDPDSPYNTRVRELDAQKFDREQAALQQGRMGMADYTGNTAAAKERRARIMSPRGGGGAGAAAEGQQGVLLERASRAYGGEENVPEPVRAAIKNVNATKHGRELHDDVDRAISEQEKNPEAVYKIPGWARNPGSPKLSGEQVERLRAGVGAFERLRSVSSRMEQLAQKITPAERLQAAVGVRSQRIQLAENLKQDAQTQLRIIGNMGVPQQFEMELVNKRAPALDSLEGWINGAGAYKALVESQRGQMQAAMGVYGYAPQRAQASFKGKAVVAATKQPDGRMLLEFEDGTTRLLR